MDKKHRSVLVPGALTALVLAFLAGATGMAFAGWVNNADDIFLSLVESGLSWCM